MTLLKRKLGLLWTSFFAKCLQEE